MSQNLKIQVVLSAIDKLTAPFQNASKQVEKLSKSINDSKSKLKGLERTQNLVNAFAQTKKALHSTSQSIDEAKNKAQQLARQLHSTANPTQKMKREFEQARNAVKRLESTQSEQIQKLKAQRAELSSNGISTRNLGQAQRQLKEQMETDKMGSGDRSAVINDIFGKIPVAGAMELISQADGALQNYEKSILDAKGTVEKVSKTMTDRG